MIHIQKNEYLLSALFSQGVYVGIGRNSFTVAQTVLYDTLNFYTQKEKCRLYLGAI
jgi:hypothetical protein